MRDHLGVRLGRKLMAFSTQFLAQLAEILDNAIMDDGYSIGRMRMRIILGRPAMRRPARMADADLALQRLFGEQQLQVLQLAFGPAAGEATGFERRDAG